MSLLSITLGCMMTLCSLEQLLYYRPERQAIINDIMYDAEMQFNCNNESQRLSLTTEISCLSRNIFWQFCTLYWYFRIFSAPEQRQYPNNYEAGTTSFLALPLCFFHFA